MRTLSSLAAALLISTFALSSRPALALDPVNKTFLSGEAIHGYDPVAYFTDKRPVKGSPAIKAERDGVT